MSRIRQLDTQTANMIAAGEVVERPMGVVKELVENAIDAGSTRIDVSVEEGGISRLTVEDNGCGMDSTDAEMAFHRHATSKISSQNDLWSIHTLGFRGEALPSIASVAKVTLRTNDGSQGTKVVIEYGKTVSVQTYACNQGTSVTVEDLFYRTPARLKHMRSAAYETSLIQNVISSFALSHPEIAFRLVSDGREAFRTTGQGDLLEVIYQVFGRGAAEYAIPAEFSDFDYKVKGYLINPVITRASRNMMHLFLNGRMVRTYKLYKAVQDGYEDFIVKGRYPLCVLNVFMDPHLLDVNVHPSKWEVRLSKEIQLENLIRDGVKNTLSGTLLAPKVQVFEAKQEYYAPISFDTDELIRQAELEQRKVQQRPQAQESFTLDEDTRKQIAAEAEEDNALLTQMMAETPKKEEPEEELPPFPLMEVIGQYHDRYILCALKDGLAVVDHRNARQRILYEEFSEKLNQEPVMMECLVPVTVHAPDDIVRRTEELNEAVSGLHITFEPFGHDTLAVHSIPAWMQKVNEVTFLEDLVDHFSSGNDVRLEKPEKKMIADLVSRNLVSSAKRLTMEEMQEIIRELSFCSNPYHAPNGKPTFIVLDEKDLTKEFRK